MPDSPDIPRLADNPKLSLLLSSIDMAAVQRTAPPPPGALFTGAVVIGNDRYLAVLELARLGTPKEVPGLCAALNDPDKRCRLVAANALGDIRSPEAIPTLLACVSTDREWIVKQAAIYALGEIGSTAAVPTVRAALVDPDADREVRYAAAWSLDRIKPASAVPDLIAVINNDPDPDVRRAAAEALSGMDSLDALQGLKLAMRNENPDVRSGAATVLGTIGEAEAIALLRDARNDPDADVREAAAAALYRIETDEPTN